MVVLTYNTFDTFKASIHGDLAKGFKALYRGSCTAGDKAAAESVVRKYYGEAAATSLHRIEAADEIARLCGDRAKGKVVWTFDQRAKANSPSPLAQATEAAKLRKAQWDPVRDTVEKVRTLGRAYLFGQAWLGWMLAGLKAQHAAAGGGRGGDRKSIGQVGPLISWSELVERETGLPCRTADRFIQLFEAAQAKLKRVKKSTGAKAALAIFEQGNPLSVPEDQRAELQELIASVCDGETQASLMRELKVIPTPPAPPETKGGSRQKQEVTAYQMAFAFFEPLAVTFTTLRTSPEADTLLAGLPEFPTDEHPLALSVLESDARDLLARIAKLRKSAKSQNTAGPVVEI